MCVCVSSHFTPASQKDEKTNFLSLLKQYLLHCPPPHLLIIKYNKWLFMFQQNAAKISTSHKVSESKLLFGVQSSSSVFRFLACLTRNIYNFLFYSNERNEILFIQKIKVSRCNPLRPASQTQQEYSARAQNYTSHNASPPPPSACTVSATLLLFTLRWLVEHEGVHGALAFCVIVNK